MLRVLGVSVLFVATSLAQTNFPPPIAPPNNPTTPNKVLLGMALFFVAAAMSLLYVQQERALTTKRTLKFLDRLPPLERADRAGLEAMLWGFPLFTLGIVTGMALSAAEYHRVLLFQAKQVFPLLAWGIFAAVLAARMARGFRGRRAAYLTMTGFLLGLLTIVGIGG